MNYENRTFDGQMIETVRYELEGGITAEEIDALKVDGFTEVLEHTLILYKPPQAQVLADTLADLAGKLPDELALEHPDLYPDWRDVYDGAEIKEGVRLRYDGGLYRAKQTHTKQHPPGTATAALYARITAEDEIPDWAPGSWDEGVKVRHKGKVWLSKVANNIWEPGGPGVHENIWKEVAGAVSSLRAARPRSGGGGR